MPEFQLKVQTDGSVTPVQALHEACNALLVRLGSMRQMFGREVQRAAVGADDYGRGYIE